MKRRLFIFLCLIPALLLLAGCAREPAPTAPPPTSAPTEPAPTDPPLAEPINVISSLVYEDPYGFELLDERTAVLVWYEYPDGEYTDSISHLDVVDLYDGTITATMVLDNADLVYGQPTQDRIFLVVSYADSTFRVMDPRLNVLRTIPVPDITGRFTEDLSKYYYTVGGILHVLDTASGACEPVEVAADYRFTTLDTIYPEENALLGVINTTLYGCDVCTIVLDLDTGELLFLNDTYGFSQATSDGFCDTAYNEEKKAHDVHFTTDWSDPLLEVPSHVFRGSHESPSPIINTDYLINCTFSEEETTACSIYHLAETVTAYHLDMSVFPEGLMSLAEAPDGSLVGMQYWEGDYCFCVLRPELLPFEKVAQAVPTEIPLVDLTMLDGLEEERDPALSGSLSDLRVRADALEETYGITILLSGQCQTPASHCEFPITTTDRVDWMDEQEYIGTALTELETALAMYPDGFFRQFRNEADEYGVLFLLVEDINSENNAIGVHYTLGQWYCIAADISYIDAVGTYCHEIWHATEVKVQSVDYTLLNDETWHACNPPEFSYSYDNTLGYLDDTSWTFVEGGWGTESWFVDAYARVNEREDRARLMEYVMAYEDTADGLMTAPALRKKLELMCDAVRQTFDTTGWEDVRWERYQNDG